MAATHRQYHVPFVQSIQGALTFRRDPRITEQHLRARHVEHRVRHIRIATRHPPLHDDGILALPRMQDRHTLDRASLLQRDRVDRVIRADYQGQIRLCEVIIDLVHLEHNVIRHASLRQKHIALSWHPTCNGVDSEPDADAFGTQEGDDVGDCILRFGNGHAVTYYDDDGLGGCQEVGGFFHRGGCYGTFRLVGRHVLRGGNPTEENICEGAVHCYTHLADC